MSGKTIICFIGKRHPPNHSFVTGMLAQALPKEPNVRVELIVEGYGARSHRPERYYGAVSVPALTGLSGSVISRLKAAIGAYFVGRILISKARRRGDQVVLVVRNNVILTLVAGRLRSMVDAFVFQSSHPLESLHRSAFKRWLHKSLLYIGCRRADGVLAVSPLGLQRVKKLAPNSRRGAVVPLLADLQFDTEIDSPVCSDRVNRHVRFVYVGTHRGRRELDVVLDGVVRALEQGVGATFSFVGGNHDEIDALRKVPGVLKWERLEAVRFISAVPRPEIPRFLMEADVGLSLVPVSDINREMSPTKLAEYMGAGLAVLASKGVDLQEKFLEKAHGGLLVEFDAVSIASGIQALVSDREQLCQLQENAKTFAQTELRYEHYVQDLLEVMGAQA